MLLEGKPMPSVGDVEHTIKYASLVCKSPEAIKTFIGLCEIMADDLLRPYGDVVIALSTVLLIKRTLDGREIDQIILDVETRKALAMERQRRAEWRKCELAVSRFRAECDQLDARLPHLAQDQGP
jgi:hypothetical protein